MGVNGHISEASDDSDKSNNSDNSDSREDGDVHNCDGDVDDYYIADINDGNNDNNHDANYAQSSGRYNCKYSANVSDGILCQLFIVLSNLLLEIDKDKEFYCGFMAGNDH